MDYMTLGQTGLEVSKLCLGCMSFGDASKGFHSGWLLDEEASRKIIKKALDIGINFFDTANTYAAGTSEEYLGRAIRDFADREEVIIATKLFFGDGQHEGRNTKGLSRKAIFNQVNASLERLGTDYIDLLYIHRWDYNTPIEETMSALNDLVRAGKVHYLGASAMYAWQFQKAQNIAEKNGWTKFSVMQNHYNMLYREDEREMIPYCQDSGVALVPYSPLAAGRLVRDWDADTARSKTDQTAMSKYDKTQEQDKEIVNRVAQVAEARGCSRAQVALAWLWQKGIHSPIVGVTKEKYLDDFMGAFKLVLTAEEMKLLDEKYLPHQIVGAL
ncbi:aldo/keto reductase [Streptococcus pseudoporcinus]|uniref:Oxidoreductase, aldo/keto reductase family protein n=1 Tax=Streptococcus pseudoporcinus LQ 940-04 TaxID=875093 RepID=G5KAL4_9STRE|nr:aldo/keto reductase [Streptococcus pseudoporcinus]EFR44577.1 oxidoreductase, aldo/keto reductase family protein [Streptococcus pseudoporcinus SPIN 20026]EHI65653.1 oxidoreductase, aldo/keto reductase family protein [Streptococcus pseudoporcinus LQ 940-04]VEF93096.1 aldo/keto reductase [Streptococcus pseudoporcinus]